MSDLQQFQMRQTRRIFLGQASLGLGSLALAQLLSSSQAFAKATEPRRANEGLPGLPHFAPRAKRVIFLCMAGGPSHLETFDYKPTLARMDGQPMPESYTRGQPIAQLQGQRLLCLAPQFRFRPCGQSGQMISEVLPHISRIADDICIIRSMHTEQINHDPAHTFMNTGTAISGRPSMGAWITYGLGSEADDLPGFIVLTSIGGRNPQPISQRQWGSAFLPGRYQGVQFNSTGAPVYYLNSPRGVAGEQQRDLINTVRELDLLRNETVANPEIETRIAQYELAFRMQTSVPALMDLSDEPQHILDMYGARRGLDGSFAANCLLARRLAERGVRFIHLYHRGWDHHDHLVRYMRVCSGLCDQASAALVTDLKQRGMLEDTLVIWGGEFGRTPMVQVKNGGVGRDHHIRGFSMWMAGGGVKPGITYGSTDELGYSAVENPVHIRDFHATMLHLLGIDHERLTVRYQGLDMKLTGVERAHVVHDIIS